MWPFDKRSEKQILEDLKIEEKMEIDLISFYSALLESGVDKCLDPDLIDQTHKNLQILKEESEKHRRMIGEIIKKYK